MVENPHTLRNVIVLAIVALVVRGGVATMRLAALDSDPDGYRAIAQNVQSSGEFARRDGDGPLFATAYRPPLYPLLLTGVVAPQQQSQFVGIALLHVVLGVATVVGTFLLARRFTTPRTALLAAALAMFDPLLLNQSTLVMTETLAALLTVTALLSIDAYRVRPALLRAAVVGFVLGLAILCRPVYLVWVGMFGVAMTIWHRRASVQLGAIVLCGLALLVTLLPWTMGNWQVFQRPIVTTTHGGYTLLLGNNPLFYDFVERLQWADAWDASEFHAAWQTRREALRSDRVEQTIASPFEELAEDAAAYDWARETMRERPGGFMLACVYRLWQLASPLPNRVAVDESRGSQVARYAVALWYIGLYCLVAFGISGWLAPDKRILAIAAFTLLLSFASVHALYWANLRMRAPLMPVLCLTAALGMEQLLSSRVLNATR